MKVHRSPRLNALTFDEEAYRAFLIEQGVSDTDLSDLDVYIAVGDEEDIADHLGDSLGVYNPSGLYIAPLRSFDIDRLNFVFLHETRHFIQDVSGFLKRDDLPYEDQPQELDADAFAWECAERGVRFFGPDNAIELLQQQCPEEFRAWVNTLLTMKGS